MPDQRWSVPADDAGLRLDKFLAAPDRLASRSRAIAAIERGKVFLNDIEATPADAARKLAAGDALRFWDDRPGSSRRQTVRAARQGELEIVYEDDVLIVVNKPPGLLAVPLPQKGGAGSVQDALVGHLRSKGKRRPMVVHRIDRDTSGLVVFAKHAESQGRLKDQFRRPVTRRTSRSAESPNRSSVRYWLTASLPRGSRGWVSFWMTARSSHTSVSRHTPSAGSGSPYTTAR